jgi:hypothetical protein
MTEHHFMGFGIVLQIGLTIGLTAIWNRRQRLKGQTTPTVNRQPPSAQPITQRQVFDQLQTLLVNYPSVTKAAAAKPEMPAKNITPLFTPLANLVQTWGYEPIGKAWETVEFNPQLHQPDVTDMQPGETVYVRFVGYRDGDAILVPAKVSRHCPES